MESTVFVGAFEAPRQPGTQSASGLYRHTPQQDEWEAVGGLPNGSRVLAIVGRPGDPRILYVGTQLGLFQSTDGGGSWTDLGVPIKNSAVFSILLHPNDPNTIYVGADHTAIYKTEDGGGAWRRLPTVQPEAALTGCFPVRVLRMALDPNAPDEVYAALEVGGFIRSLDGGESWEDWSRDLLDMSEQSHLKSAILSDSETEGMLDLHALIVSPTEPGTVWIANRMGLFVSENKGQNWREFGIGRFSDYSYGRDLIVSPHDPAVFLAALSTSARGDAGSLCLSRDKGETWQRVDHDISIDSTVMKVAISDQDPNRIYGVARLGQVFGTEDGGATWNALPLLPGISDVRAVHCI
jgi:photosystem II stability/assembly factor-like uncharacterized protein